jgi:hypothetical protein
MGDVRRRAHPQTGHPQTGHAQTGDGKDRA